MTIVASRQELAFTVKELRKLYNKEGQAALKKHYERQLQTASRLLNECLKYDSGYKTPRTPWKKCPQVKFEIV